MTGNDEAAASRAASEHAVPAAEDAEADPVALEEPGARELSPSRTR